MKNVTLVIMLALSLWCCKKSEPAQTTIDKLYAEKFRPQFHFTPKEKWMNDPNGMVYHEGEYHLFYQYHPESLVWGPMHWGHAVSTDLVNWTHLPIALYPDSLGMIFSGSAVVDKNNTTGFGTPGNPPLVAVFTYHDAAREKEGKNDFQTQGIAYSLDKGRSWTKYEHNPVIGNTGVRDFRDPKVFWHEETKKWVMVLVAGDHAELYGSPDLKTWTKLSEFGKEFGAHGGVWECPDLFPLTVEGEKTKKWVMIININPGAPNGGSGTQYFLGEFDGKVFSCDSKKSKTAWIDYGPDNYAGITWSNAPGDRKIFIGWMSNWAYAQEVPTDPWRSASTIPRELTLARVNDSLYVRSLVSPEIQYLIEESKEYDPFTVNDSLDLTSDIGFPITTSVFEGSVEAKDFVLEFSNDLGQRIGIGYEAAGNRYFINRKESGATDFSKTFASGIFAPRIATNKTIKFTVLLDASSVEVFFDDGLSVMTSLFFPDKVYQRVKIQARSGTVEVDHLTVGHVSSIW
jgi:fructan beta-fructosidase